jgi:hypothetical protein
MNAHIAIILFNGLSFAAGQGSTAVLNPCLDPIK